VFKKIIASAVRKSMQAELYKDPFFQKISVYVHEYFSSNDVAQLRETMITQMLKDVQDVEDSANSVLTLREYIDFYVSEFSVWKVLCLTEAEKLQPFYTDCNGLSGTLWQSISQTVEHVPQLRELKWKKSTLDDKYLIDYCKLWAWRNHFHFGALNILRFQHADVIEGRDWFYPYIKSSMRYSEYELRKKIGLPLEHYGQSEAGTHCLAASFVRTGIRNPYFEIDTLFEKSM
jgi:hypothetical protein